MTLNIKCGKMKHLRSIKNMIQIEELVKTSKKPNIFSVSFFKPKNWNCVKKWIFGLNSFDKMFRWFSQKNIIEKLIVSLSLGLNVLRLARYFPWANEIVSVKATGNIESCKEMIFSWVRKNTSKEKIPKKCGGNKMQNTSLCILMFDKKNPGSIQNNTGYLGQQVGGIEGSPAAFLFLNKVRGNQLGTETSSNS